MALYRIQFFIIEENVLIFVTYDEQTHHNSKSVDEFSFYFFDKRINGTASRSRRRRRSRIGLFGWLA
jgi:hypothetical protein